VSYFNFITNLFTYLPNILMHRRITFGLIAGLLLPLIGASQTSNAKQLNLDFEQSINRFPAHWGMFGSGDYRIDTDSTVTQSGRYSAVIKSTGQKSGYQALSLKLPENYQGKSIRLSGYIKTENVTGGYAGLWLRIDPQLGFDNMANRGITGTTDWQEYEISLPLAAEKTDQIFIGGLLVGEGKMWIDNLSVTIDGHDLEDDRIEVYTEPLLPADVDREFDQGTKIIFPHLTETTLDNLALLGRIWGFLKYFHPAIAKGNYNWDYELFRVLPSYLAAKDTGQRDQVLSLWLDKLGEPDACAECGPVSDGAVLKPDLSWIEDSDLSPQIKASLRYIYANRNQGDHYYIRMLQGVGNPEFTNEKTYDSRTFPDSGFRLLSLFKYWNMI